MKRLISLFFCLSLFTLYMGCAQQRPAPSFEGVDVDKALRSEIGRLELTGDPSTGRDIPDIDSAMAQLGMMLYYTKALSVTKDVACASCHHPSLAGGDALSLGVGVGAVDPDVLGPGRKHSPDADNYTGRPTIPRHAPTAFNVAMWDDFLLWDGRIESLGKVPGANGAVGGIRTPDTPFGVADPNAGKNLSEALNRFPVVAPLEMMGFDLGHDVSGDFVRTALARRLQGKGSFDDLQKNDWLIYFREVYGRPDGTAEELITFANIAEAIGAFQSSMVFVDTPWKRYVQGDDNAISREAKIGALLFFTPAEQGGLDCAACHSGDFFTDEKFHVLGVPQIGPGAGDNNGATRTADFGRFREHQLFSRENRYAFRTPTLLNVEITGPYGHDGAYTTLEGMVRHNLNPEQAVRGYDLSQLDPTIDTSDWKVNTSIALQQLKKNRQNRVRPVLQSVNVDDRTVGYLMAFLQTLTDPCAKDRDCLAKWIPGPDTPDPDNMRLVARDGKGDLL